MSAFTSRFSGNKMGFDLLPYLRVEFLFPALALCFVPLLMLWKVELAEETSCTPSSCLAKLLNTSSLGLLGLASSFESLL